MQNYCEFKSKHLMFVFDSLWLLLSVTDWSVPTYLIPFPSRNWINHVCIYLLILPTKTNQICLNIRLIKLHQFPNTKELFAAILVKSFQSIEVVVDKHKHKHLVPKTIRRTMCIYYLKRSELKSCWNLCLKRTKIKQSVVVGSLKTIVTDWYNLV